MTRETRKKKEKAGEENRPIKNSRKKRRKETREYDKRRGEKSTNGG